MKFPSRTQNCSHRNEYPHSGVAGVQKRKDRDHRSQKAGTRAAQMVVLLGLTTLSRGTAPAHAQAGPQVSSAPILPGAPLALSAEMRERVAKYQLGPQDVLSIVVERFPPYSSPSVVVPPDGKIALPYFGTLSVIGKTAPQVERELTRILAKRMRNPKVSASLIRLRPASEGSVFVIGNVRIPGSVEITKGYRLTEVISRVGGIINRADETRGLLARSGQPPIKLDLNAAISKPLSSANIRVRAGDVITIQDLDPGRIAINGDVVRPGVFEMRRAPRAAYYELPAQPRVADAVVAAGGVAYVAGTGTSAIASGRVSGYIQRKDRKIDLRMQEILESGEPSTNVLLQAGDFLTIRVDPPMSVFVSGFVRGPGAIQVQPGSDIMQTLAQAGGLSRPLDQVTATLQRGQAKLPIDLPKVLAGDSSANIKVLSGDVLQIDEPVYINVDVAGRVGKASSDEPLHLPRNATVMDAIARVGGLAIDPDKATISVLRKLPNGEQKFLSIDPVALYTNRDPSQNARLAEGDLITVSDKRRLQVIVSGEVLRPGPYDIREGQSIGDAIAQAGGHKPTAALTSVKLQRGNTTVVVDALDAVQSGKPIAGEFGTVRDQDSIIVPENRNYVFVWEAVNKPGRALLPERERYTILDAIGAAGGYKPNAKVQDVVLWREVAPQKMQATVISLKDLERGKNLAVANQTLQANDLVIVPEGGVKTSKMGIASNALGLLYMLRGFGG